MNTCDYGNNPYDPDYTSAVDSGCATNYWAGAMATCEEKGMHVPSLERLSADLASIIYGEKIDTQDDKVWDTGDQRIEAYRDILPEGVYITDDYLSKNAVWARDMGKYGTYPTDYVKNTNDAGYYVICIGAALR